jgi:phosphatidylglycerol lysyltransferase
MVEPVTRLRRFSTTLGTRIPVWVVALVTLGSGIANLLSVLRHSHFRRNSVFSEVFPLEFFHISRLLTLLIGFALVISSLNILKGKRRAWQGAVILTSISIPFHLAQGLDVRGAVFSAILLVVLLLTRRSFRVRSSTRTLAPALLRILVAVAVAFAYGVFGFWVLDKRQFGIEFTTVDSIHRTLHFLLLIGDPEIVPKTHYARWFLDSLYMMSVVTMTYAIASLYRPVIYRYRTHDRERALARSIVAEYGRSTMDFFKYGGDKSFFFSPSQRTVIAYGVAGNQAIVLSDPVGPEEEIEDATRLFRDFCGENDWNAAFYQTLPDFLPIYARLGYRKLKIGDDAIVDLIGFSLEGRPRKELRHSVRMLEKMGITSNLHDPPISAGIVQQVREISDEWLQLPHRRERQFTLGLFDPDYIRSTPLLVLRDETGRALAFANLIPSYVPGEATIDLMRRSTTAPNGVMDFLLVRLFEYLKERGYARFNLGMAPMAGFSEREKATPEERTVHSFFQRLNFLFSYEGLRAYKAKFATSWEPRFLVYQSPLDLPRIVLALQRISEVKERNS